MKQHCTICAEEINEVPAYFYIPQLRKESHHRLTYNQLPLCFCCVLSLVKTAPFLHNHNEMVVNLEERALYIGAPSAEGVTTTMSFSKKDVENLIAWLIQEHKDRSKD